MKFDDILSELSPIELSDANDQVVERTLFDSYARMIELGEKVGKTGLRATQSTELIGERLDRLDEESADQLRERELDLKKERERLGELEDRGQQLVESLIQVTDLSRAAATAAGREVGEECTNLFTMLNTEAERICKRVGLEETASVGEKLAPEFHEVAEEVDRLGHAATEIIEIVRQGYRYRGKVVRIAKVVIAR